MKTRDHYAEVRTKFPDLVIRGKVVSTIPTSEALALIDSLSSLTELVLPGASVLKYRSDCILGVKLNGNNLPEIMVAPLHGVVRVYDPKYAGEANKLRDAYRKATDRFFD